MVLLVIFLDVKNYTKLCMYLLYHSLTCTEGCDPVKENTDAVLKLDCKENPQCQNIVWNIVDPSDNDWPVSLIYFLDYLELMISYY